MNLDGTISNVGLGDNPYQELDFATVTTATTYNGSFMPAKWYAESPGASGVAQPLSIIGSMIYLGNTLQFGSSSMHPPENGSRETTPENFDQHYRDGPLVYSSSWRVLLNGESFNGTSNRNLTAYLAPTKKDCVIHLGGVEITATL